jgi:signal transduction histidine kinase
MQARSFSARHARLQPLPIHTPINSGLTIHISRSAFCAGRQPRGQDRVQADAQPAIDEALRLATLRAYGILDTPPEDCFDQLVRAAAAVFAAPIGLVSLVDDGRVWFKARIGLDAAEIPRVDAFCAHALLTGGVAMVVPNAHADARFRDNTLVVGEPHVSFYAGVRLTAPNGLPIGTLCVLDPVAHVPPDARQIAALTDLAAITIEAIELRSAGRAAQEAARISRLVTDRLHDAHRGLLAAYRAKSEFLSSLSHELRTPLNAMIGYAELIATGVSPPNSLSGHAQAISEAGRHMLILVNDILEFSRLEAGEVRLAWHPVALPRLLDESLRMVGAFARSREIRLVQEVGWPDCEVRGDPVRLKQVLLNLLTNAIKFTPRSGEVRICLLRDGDGAVALDVHDTGIGIAPDDIAKVLTPFGQVVAQDDRQREGTGLGLPIARCLVERHGGSLNIESRLDRGTRVRISLPALRANTARLTM